MDKTRVEEYQVTIKRDEETGQRLSELWKSRNMLHRIDGPAKQVWNPASGELRVEAYYEWDKLHREDGPAYVERDKETGIITYESWYSNGVADRDGDLPARIERDYRTGIVTVEQYMWSGLEHRDNGPSCIIRDGETGATIRESYYDHGFLRREVEFEGPWSLPPEPGLDIEPS